MAGTGEPARLRRLEWLLFGAAAFALLVLTLSLAADFGRTRAAEALRVKAGGSITLDVAVLRSELDKQRALPFVLSQDPDVLAVLASRDPARIAGLNEKFEALSRATRSAVIYLLDAGGTAIVASNWREPTSFVGSDYRFRPYYTGAVADGATEHFALGTVSQRPGLYISRRIDGAGGMSGVIVVKVEFDQVEADWRQSGAIVYVADQRGIVLITSAPDWRFLTERPIGPDVAAAIRASLQFGKAPLALLPVARREGSDFVTLPGGRLHLASGGAVATTPWRLTVLLPARVELNAGAHTFAAAALGILAPVLALAGLLLYRRQLSQARATAELEARAELERRVEARTHDLRATNDRLTDEIEERQKVEAKLQIARDELAQANRLALLGQITAGLAHEVNQPVAAIRSYADNAAAFLERNEPGAVRDNLVTIAGLTEKIGAITGELRGFARKGTGAVAPTEVLEAVDGALLLVGTRARRQGVDIAAERPEAGLSVVANRVRLEQVLVNLLQNALDALEGASDPEIHLGFAAAGEEVRLSVADNGPGIAPEVMAALFTPFTTTKPRGLGLGLVISKGIVDEFGGRLDVASTPAGTRFTVLLEEGAMTVEPLLPVAFVDDDAELRRANAQTLQLAGFAPLPFASAAEALAAVDANFAGVVVTDLRMPRVDGMQLFRHLRGLDADLPVILITGHGDIATAVEAMREGAYDFLAKPFAADRLIQSVRRAMEKRSLVMENRRLRQAAEAAATDAPLIGDAPAIRRLRETLRAIADADVDVLVVGETGSGKEVVAGELHRLGRRRAGEFVALNCAALPESVIESELFGHEAGAFTGAQKKRVGLIEHSSGGTLFLDEIESMPLGTQAKLLRVLERREITPLGTNTVKPVDLRVVAAAKSDLGHASQRATFREDLFHRLNVVTLRVPPVRERREDVPLLFAHFLARAAQRFRREAPDLSAPVRRHLLEHDWPGNVREIVHFSERVVLGLAEVDADRSPALVVDAGSLPERVEFYEARLIREALTQHRGDVRATLEALGIPRKTFYDKLQRYGISRASFEG